MGVLKEFFAADFEVEAVTDGEQAWAAVQRQSRDLLLTDYQMPVLDGLGLVHRLRADARWSTSPIVFLTGRIGEDTEFRCMEAGASALMLKPFRPLELLACLHAQLGDRCWCANPGSQPSHHKNEGNMKTPYLNPLIPLGESTDETLRRLSSNIRTLTGLIGDAEHTGHLYLAGMFSRSRDTKVAEAQAVIASAQDGNANALEEANKGWKHAERSKNGIEFFSAEALLLMDAAAVNPERRFLLVGISLAGMGAAPFTSRRPRREGTRFALVEGFPPAAVHSRSFDRQPA